MDTLIPTDGEPREYGDFGDFNDLYLMDDFDPAREVGSLTGRRVFRAEDNLFD